jgi:NAD(P)H-hydrate repair Nnr-like enzyme with NAD(P)H-hydrate dehydratase domain
MLESFFRRKSMFKAAAVAGFLLASAVPAMASAADDVIVSVVPDAGLAASALLAHDFDKAARKLQAVWPDTINDPARLINLGNAYAGMGRTSDAREAYAAVSRVPDMMLVLADGSEESSRSIAQRASARLNTSYAMR